MSKHELLSDDFTNIEIVRPSSYGYAQPDQTAKRTKRKNPIGFAPWPKPSKQKPRPKK